MDWADHVQESIPAETSLAVEQTILPTSIPTRLKTWRDGLRILIGFLLLYAAIWALRVVMGVGIVSYIVLPAIALRKVLNINPWLVLFPFHKDWWKDLLFGFLLVAVILTFFFVIEVKIGWLAVNSWTWQTLTLDDLLRTTWVGLLVNVGVAIGEETIFRGYLLTSLKTVLGKWPALLIMMVIFGLFHLPAYSASGGMHSWTLTLAILLATLFGGLFGLIYLHTKSLWLPISLHFSWNFIENDVLNLTAVSNNPNLIGAQTRLQSPLTTSGFSLGNVVVLEMVMFALIALGTWLFMRFRNLN